MGAIAEAKAKEEQWQSLKGDAEQYGISLWPGDVDTYVSLRTRLRSNDRLDASFKAAKKAGIRILLGTSFFTSAGNVAIDAGASDEKIIEFLGE
jgi:hypothetical protein